MDFPHLKQVQVQQEICSKHNENLVSFRNMAPFCQSCRKESIEQEESKLVEAAETWRKRRETKLVLSRDSIYSDRTLKKASFETFETDNDLLVTKKDEARKYAYKYLKQSFDPDVFNNKGELVKKGERFDNDAFSVYIFSKASGSGKSHLSMSILKAVNDNSEQWRSCLYVSVRKLVMMLTETWNKKSEVEYTKMSLVNLVSNADLVVLDDLGAESSATQEITTAKFFVTEFLTEILEGRIGKSTIITSNFDYENLNGIYDTRTISRLFEGSAGNLISLEGLEDKRLFKNERRNKNV